MQRQQESPPISGGGVISYAYDALGRLSTRTVGGAGPEAFQYDAIGRLTGHSSDLGAFTLTYLGQTGQITGRQLANSTLATTWSYLPNSGDRRLAGINNTGLSSGQSTAYQFTTTPENFISSIAETSDQSIPTPPTAQQTASYNALNQLTSLSGQALSWDANGNLLSDGGRAYSWDAENRLIGITYPGQTGKQTAFAYDGLGRRVAITSTPAGGGSAVAASYVWCGDNPCQARNASGVSTRAYYAEGELVSGQPVYYGKDQIGSVRRAFASASYAPAYAYDPYGNALQTTAPLTDFRYAGMFVNADSGLYLTKYRAYDPVSGRWLSRDPIGESGGINLYAYVGGNPLVYIDSSGQAASGKAIGGTIGGWLGGGLGIETGPFDAATIFGGRFLGGIVGSAIEDYIVAMSGSDSSSRPPPGSLPISSTPWSGDHQAIKGEVGAGPSDNVKIDPDNNVWVQNPDGSWTNYGPAGDYTGSGQPSGRTGKDRQRNNCDE